MNNRWLKGKFVPKNPNKYKGNANDIVFRSSWELVFMNFCDNTPGILAWASETTVIRYHDPIQNKDRNYFVDFRIITRQADGSAKVFLIEIKPEKQTKKPRNTGNKSEKTLLSEQTTYITNQAKWTAARAYCKALGWDFLIFTERDLYGDLDKTNPDKRKPKRGT